MHVVEYIIDSYHLRRREKLQFCVQAFITNIELQELTHAGGKPCVLCCDMTEAPLEANNFQQVMKLQNPTLSYHKRGHRLRLGNTIIECRLFLMLKSWTQKSIFFCNSNLRSLKYHRKARSTSKTAITM